MKRVFSSASLLLIAIGCNNSSTPDLSANKSPQPSVAAVKSHDARKDNSVINERDRAGATKTPLDQKENQSDIDITAKIRKRVVEIKMSSNAHNSKIITADGKVTLRGPVSTVDEKERIEQIATDVAGVGNVDNQLEVQP